MKYTSYLPSNKKKNGIWHFLFLRYRNFGVWIFNWNLSSQIETSNCQVTVNNILICLGTSRTDDIPAPTLKDAIRGREIA